MATAQNGFEVLRWGGLETGAVPSPFQIVESTNMYKLRRYFPPDNRPGRAKVGPPVLMVHGWGGSFASTWQEPGWEALTSSVEAS